MGVEIVCFVFFFLRFVEIFKNYFMCFVGDFKIFGCLSGIDILFLVWIIFVCNVYDFMISD